MPHQDADAQGTRRETATPATSHDAVDAVELARPKTCWTDFAHRISNYHCQMLLSGIFAGANEVR